MKKEIEVGQVIHVSVSGWLGGTKPNLSPYVVDKVNTVSFYAKPVGSDRSSRRFDKRKLCASDSFGDYYYAYLTESEYWDRIKKQEEVRELSKELIAAVRKMSLQELRKLKQEVSKL